MKTKSYYFVLLALLSLSITPREVLGQQDRNTVKEPYSMSVQALRGALGTEVCVTIKSIDPQTYPLPTSIKQLVADPDDGPKYRLEKYTGDDIPLTNGRTTFVLRGYENCQSINVKVHFKLERWHDEHLEDDIHVCSKPNLSIEKIVAPEQTYVNTPFNVQAVIRESKGDAGATTTVTLYEGSSVLGSFTNVVVPKGGTVNVVFQGISAATPGKHYYTIKISNTDPPEFDVTNNSRSFSVNVLGRPDLKVEKITVPEKVFANDAFDIQAFIRETTGSSDVTATVSLYDGSTLVTSISRVEVRDGSTERVTFRDVKTTTPGQHSYTVTISNANPPESNVANNSLTVTMTVLLKPDLVVESATAPSPIFASTFFDVDAVIRELNGQSGATATASLYEGKSIQALPRKVTVSAGGTAHVLFQGIKESAGTHTYIIKLSDVEPSETHEANNTYTFSLVVVLRPDLKVDKVTSPQSVTVKVPFNVDAIIKEIDGQSGASATVTLYEGTTSLGSFPNISVPASGSTTVSFSGIVATSQGHHNYTVKITNANPAESDVSNNNYSFSLTAVAKPDLVVDNISAPGSVPAGTPFDLTATVKELLGVVGASATVTLYDGSNAAVGTSQPVTVAAGSSANVVFSGIMALSSGTYTVRISGSIPAESNTSNNDKSVSITVIAATVSLSQSIITISQSTVASGSTATITLQAKDAAGNNLTAGGLSVAFSVTGGGTIEGVTDHLDGTYTATFTGTTAGTATVSATIGGSPVTSTIPPITVTPGPVSLSQSIVTISPSTVASGSTATITLQAKDAAGNNLTTGGLTVAFLATGVGTIGSVTDNNNGTYTATFTATTVGTATVSATIAGSPVTSTLPTITVTAGAVSLAQSTVTISPSTVASGATAAITLQAKDAAGNNLTTGGLSVAFSATGVGTVGSVTDNHDGTYTATFTATTVGTATISATIGGSPVTSTLPSITVTAGAVSLSQSIVTISPSTVASGTDATITLQAKDAAGNNLTTGGLSVAFSVTGGGTIGNVSYNGNGVYTATFTGVTAGTSTLSATIDGSPVTSTLPTITVTPGTVSLAQSVVTIAPATVALGSTAAITLQAKDAAGNNLTTGGLTTVAFSATGVGTVGLVTDKGDGTYSATFTGTTAGTATVTATIDGNPVASAPTITVTVTIDMPPFLDYVYHNIVHSWDEIGVGTYYDSLVTDNSTFTVDAGVSSVSIPGTPIDEISWNIETAGGVFDQESFTNPARTGGEPNIDIYSASGLNNKGITYTLTINRNNGTIHFHLGQGNSGGYHSWQYTDGRHVAIDPPGVLRPQSFISFTVLVRCGPVSWVGTKSDRVPPLSQDLFTVPHPTDILSPPVYEPNPTGTIWRHTRFAANVTSAPVTNPEESVSRKLPGKDVIAEETAAGSALPVVYSLGQNYPNPFNPSTNVVFCIANSGFVSLRVYDLLGREVAILASGEFKAGTHRVLWNAAGVPSGTYFYRLQSGEFVAQKKLLLLK